MERLEIKKLVDKNDESFEIVCHWHYNWWGKRDGYSMAQIISYVTHSLGEDKIPLTYVALLDQVPVGMYQLLMYDNLIHRPDIYPWLANVFVDAPHRGQGICRALMLSVEKHARDIGLEELFLFTNHDNLYEKFGWEFVEDFETFRENSPIEKLYRLEIKK